MEVMSDLCQPVARRLVLLRYYNENDTWLHNARRRGRTRNAEVFPSFLCSLCGQRLAYCQN